MELKVIKNEDNKLFERKDVKFDVIDYDSTPSKDKVKTELCKKLNVLPNLTIIEKLDQEFGMKRLNGLAHVYSDEKSIDKYERKYILKRNSKNEKAEEKKEEKSEA